MRTMREIIGRIRTRQQESITGYVAFSIEEAKQLLSLLEKQENEAVEFAEWCDNNKNELEKLRWKNKNRAINGIITPITTSELYTLFQQSKG